VGLKPPPNSASVAINTTHVRDHDDLARCAVSLVYDVWTPRGILTYAAAREVNFATIAL